MVHQWSGKWRLAKNPLVWVSTKVYQVNDIPALLNLLIGCHWFGLFWARDLVSIFLEFYEYFFWPWKHKKTDLKSSILMAVWIFFLCSPKCPKQSRIEYPFYRFLYPMICGTISGIWAMEICCCWLNFLSSFSSK